MAWGEGGHETWAAAELPDGRLSVGSGAGGPLVRADAELRGGWREGEPQVADGRTVIRWRGVCECGWRGPLHRRTAADPGLYGDAPEGVDEAIYRDWEGPT